jgi:CheY-like chemotaxis protein
MNDVARPVKRYKEHFHALHQSVATEGIGFVLLQFIAQETPYQALLVTTGQAALRAVSTTTPSLLLLDYRLPGMNGIELYDQLQQRKGGRAIPAIMISATLPSHEIRQRDMVGMKKPFDIDDLLQTIETMIQ